MQKPTFLSAKLFFFSIIIALFLHLPYLLAYLTTQDGQFYTGLIMNPEDSQTYWAKMTQGLNGAWAYTIPFTTEPHDAAYVGIFYVWLGQLARLTGLSLTAVWHTSRFIADIILFITTYWFITLFYPITNYQLQITNSPTLPLSHSPINGRLLALLLAIFGSGLGWVLFIFQQPYWLNTFPVDFKQPGAHLFFTAMTFPHITLGTVCILISIGFLKKIGDLELSQRPIKKTPTIHHSPFTIYLSLITKNYPLALIFGLSNLLLAIAYPFLIYIVAGTAVFYGIAIIWQKRALPWVFGSLTAVAFLIPAPLYLYYVNVLSHNAVFKAWDVQAITPSAPWPHYLIAFGPYLWLAWIFWRNRPQERMETAVLFAWLLTVLLLLYAPLNPQRRFIQGVQVPLAILSTLAITHHVLPNWIKSARWQKIVSSPRYETDKLARLLMVIFLLFMGLSNIYLWADVARTAVLVQPDPLFRPIDEQIATDWLRENSDDGSALFGTMQTGNLVAAQTAVPVFIGHWAETLDYEQKQLDVEQFFDSNTNNDWRRDLLDTHNITYLWYGPREQAVGTFNPAELEFLTPVYENTTITLYKKGEE